MALVDGKGETMKPAVERKNPGKGSRDRLRDEGFATPDGKMLVKVKYAENGSINEIIVESKDADIETGVAREKYVIGHEQSTMASRRTGMLEEGENLVLKVASKHGDLQKGIMMDSDQSKQLIELGKFLLAATHAANKPPIQEMIATDIVTAVRRVAPAR